MNQQTDKNNLETKILELIFADQKISIDEIRQISTFNNIQSFQFLRDIVFRNKINGLFIDDNKIYVTDEYLIHDILEDIKKSPKIKICEYAQKIRTNLKIIITFLKKVEKLETFSKFCAIDSDYFYNSEQFLNLIQQFAFLNKKFKITLLANAIQITPDICVKFIEILNKRKILTGTFTINKEFVVDENQIKLDSQNDTKNNNAPIDTHNQVKSIQLTPPVSELKNLIPTPKVFEKKKNEIDLGHYWNVKIENKHINSSVIIKNDNNCTISDMVLIFDDSANFVLKEYSYKISSIKPQDHYSLNILIIPIKIGTFKLTGSIYWVDLERNNRISKIVSNEIDIQYAFPRIITNFHDIEVMTTNLSNKSISIDFSNIKYFNKNDFIIDILTIVLKKEIKRLKSPLNINNQNKIEEWFYSDSEIHPDFCLGSIYSDEKNNYFLKVWTFTFDLLESIISNFKFYFERQLGIIRTINLQDNLKTGKVVELSKSLLEVQNLCELKFKIHLIKELIIKMRYICIDLALPNNNIVDLLNQIMKIIENYSLEDYIEELDAEKIQKKILILLDLIKNI